jgi:hypothetical protein
MSTDLFTPKGLMDHDYTDVADDDSFEQDDSGIYTLINVDYAKQQVRVDLVNAETHDPYHTLRSVVWDGNQDTEVVRGLYKLLASNEKFSPAHLAYIGKELGRAEQQLKWAKVAGTTMPRFTQV